MAVYTDPTSFAPDQLVTSTFMNTNVTENIKALKDPPSDNYECNEASNYTTTSSSFTDVDATNLALTLTTTGGVVLVGFHGAVGGSTGIRIYFEIDIDGSPVGTNDGIIAVGTDATIRRGHVSFVRRITGLSASSHTIKLQWKVSSGTGTLWAGAGTSGLDIHPQFWAVER